MKLEQLRVFVASVEAKSFSQAASQLGMSQSTVSFHVAALESDLGARVLERGRGGVRLTHSGRILLPRARDLLAQAAEARALVTGESAGGTVLVEASTVPATFLLPPVLAELGRVAPDVGVVLRVSDSGRALRNLRERGCDIAVVGSPPPNSGLVHREIGRDRIVLVGRPGLTPAADMPLVVREAESGTRRASDSLLRTTGRRVEVGSTEAARRCALEGVGFTLISERAVREDVSAGRLVIHPLPGTPVERSFHALRLRAVRLGPAARRLWSALIGPAS